MQPDLYYKSPGGTQKVRMALYSHFFISIETKAVLKGNCKEIFISKIIFRDTKSQIGVIVTSLYRSKKKRV
jgi:hypothetical protein